MWKFKSCPRCGGDVFIDSDEEHRWYEQCLQCGFFHELKDIAKFSEQSADRDKERVSSSVKAGLR